MVKRVVFILLGVVVMALALSSVAMAANHYTPQDIYNDFADNGKLDRHYSDSELRAYLNDSTVAQYADRDKKRALDDLVNDMLTRDTFPFTGFQLMVAGIVAVVLVGGGIALRRFSRPQKS